MVKCRLDSEIMRQQIPTINREEKKIGALLLSILSAMNPADRPAGIPKIDRIDMINPACVEEIPNRSIKYVDDHVITPTPTNPRPNSTNQRSHTGFDLKINLYVLVEAVLEFFGVN